jgi:hypothetical protein
VLNHSAEIYTHVRINQVTLPLAYIPQRPYDAERYGEGSKRRTMDIPFTSMGSGLLHLGENMRKKATLSGMTVHSLFQCVHSFAW